MLYVEDIMLKPGDIKLKPEDITFLKHDTDRWVQSAIQSNDFHPFSEGDKINDWIENMKKLFVESSKYTPFSLIGYEFSKLSKFEQLDKDRGMEFSDSAYCYPNKQTTFAKYSRDGEKFIIHILSAIDRILKYYGVDIIIKQIYPFVKDTYWGQKVIDLVKFVGKDSKPERIHSIHIWYIIKRYNENNTTDGIATKLFNLDRIFAGEIVLGAHQKIAYPSISSIAYFRSIVKHVKEELSQYKDSEGIFTTYSILHILKLTSKQYIPEKEKLIVEYSTKEANNAIIERREFNINNVLDNFKIESKDDMNDSITLIPGTSFLEPMQIVTNSKITKKQQQMQRQLQQKLQQQYHQQIQLHRERKQEQFQQRRQKRLLIQQQEQQKEQQKEQERLDKIQKTMDDFPKRCRIIDAARFKKRGDGLIPMPARFIMKDDGTIWCDYCGGPHEPGEHKFNEEGEPRYLSLDSESAQLYADIEAGNFD